MQEHYLGLAMMLHWHMNEHLITPKFRCGAHEISIEKGVLQIHEWLKPPSNHLKLQKILK